MSEPFIGEIKMFGGNFAPRGYALCDGQTLSISSNTALFSLLGTTYGGDGRTTFQLPDLRSRVPMHAGNGPGLTPRSLGHEGGAETETLTLAQVPAHSHGAYNGTGDEKTPEDHLPATADDGERNYSSQAANVTLGGSSGGNQAHNNIQPFLVINYIIALTGVFPSRN